MCTIDSNGTGSYSLHFTAVFMRAVLPTSVYDSSVYDSIVYDSIVYDSIVYGSIATDGLTRLPALPVYIPTW